MAVLSSKQQLLLLLMLLFLVGGILCAAHATTQPNPNCAKICGSVRIPFPSGTTEGCSLDSSFLIHCNNKTPYLSQTNLIVLNISLNGELRVSSPVATDCYNEDHTRTSPNTVELELNRLGHFDFSPGRNKLISVGCDTVGSVKVYDTDEIIYPTGCVSFCYRKEDIPANGSCPTTGCCKASIPSPGQRLSKLSYEARSLNNHTVVAVFNPCSYAFLVEDGAYHFVSTDLKNMKNTTFPVVLDWTVGNQVCEEAKNTSGYACKAKNSECDDRTKGLGYLCKCSDGFRGNPYVHDGCKGVNKCEESNYCVKRATCHKSPGGYSCLCRRGYEGDGRSDGQGCRPKSSPRRKSSSRSKSRTKVKVAIGLTVGGISITVVVTISVHWTLKTRKLIKLKRLFQKNGGLLLQQKIARHIGSTEIAKIFTVEELKKATNNFDEDMVLGHGGQAAVYKGELHDNTTVAIKKSKISDPSQIEQFINEVVMLSQINHTNVVRLLGCCLETEDPLLVYEFVPNGTIYEHLHDHSQSLKLTWKTRLRIAAETAGALAYLHSATSTPIIHRDVKTTNILLDRDLTAKVSDLGASRIVPLDGTQVTTLVQAYLDPEYFHTSQLTEKSDVYSFGVVLAEFLTGRKAFSSEMPKADRNLEAYFVSSMEEGRLLHLVDNHIIDEAKVEVLIEFANIAKQCLKLKGEERPTMKEVAMKLEGLRVKEKHRESNKLTSEYTRNLLEASSSVFDVEDDTG